MTGWTCGRKPRPYFAMRSGIGLFGMGAILAVCLGMPGQALAREGDTQTTVFIGTSFIAAGSDTTEGSTLGARWGYEFYDDLLWTVGGAYTATQGQKSVSGTNYTLTANTTSLQTGLLYFFGRKPGKLVTPFVGGGAAVLSYDVDYRYPGSTVGKTSGTAPGAFAFAGIELWLARAVTLILSYDEEVYSISKQGGGSTNLATGGVILALRINFYSG